MMHGQKNIKEFSSLGKSFLSVHRILVLTETFIPVSTAKSVIFFSFNDIPGHSNVFYSQLIYSEFC
jgi:hypothetical protein